MDFLDSPRRTQQWKQTVPRLLDKVFLQTRISFRPKYPRPPANLSRLYRTDLAPSVAQCLETRDLFWSCFWCGTPVDVSVEIKDGQTTLRKSSFVYSRHSQTTSGNKQEPCEWKLKQTGLYMHVFDNHHQELDFSLSLSTYHDERAPFNVLPTCETTIYGVIRYLQSF